MPPRIAPKLLIIGWDAADWKIIDALLAQGGMPNLKRLIEAGVRGDLTSLDPKLSPLLWTSIATGKTADKHGILNFIEPDPAGAGLRVSCSTTRRVKAVWNILTQSGLRTNVVSWYATHPAEPIRGAVVSNLFQEGAPPAGQGAWPLIPASVHPPSLSESIAQLRLHPAELTGEEMLALIPNLRRINPADPRLRLAARLVAQCASVHNAATALLSPGEPWDCTMVFYETIDVVGHHFMQYYSPRMAHVSPQDFEDFRHVVPGVYQLQDAMLGRLLELAGPQATVILLSDHGFHSDHLRPRVQAAFDDPHAAMDATWHRPLGVLVMSGPGIKAAQTIHGAGLLDITPTALTLLGLPVGADMDGRVLVEALDRPAPVERVFSWDTLEGEAGLHPADLRVDPFEARDAMAQLADLGYIARPDGAGEPGPGSGEAQLAMCDRETRFNLGVVYMTTSRQSQAIPVFERLHREHPANPRFAFNLVHCLYTVGRHQEALAVADTLVAAHPDIPDAQMLRGATLFARGDVRAAAEALEHAVRQAPDRPDLLCSMADAYTHLKRWDDAERTLDRAASLDPHDPIVHHKRALLALAQEQFAPAAEHALTAVELRHFFPEAHYTLGVALTWMKNYDYAIQSFKVALSMQPGMVDAHRYIASIYRHKDDRRSARPHRDAAERLLKSLESGGSAGAMPMHEPPMGPQEWDRRFGTGSPDEPAA